MGGCTPSTGWAVHAERVRFVEQQSGVVLVTQRAQGAQVGDVAVHREQALGEDPRTGARGARTERLLDGLDREVRGHDDASAGEPAAVDDGGMVASMGAKGVLVGEGRDGAQVGGEGARAKQALLRLSPVGELALQRVVLGEAALD